MKFLRQLAISIAATVVLLVAPTGGTASAASTTFGSSMSNPILCGLLAGANFDLEGGLNCTTSTQSSSPVASTVFPMQSRTATPTRQTYAALGDSVAAGLGLPQSSTATSQDQQCGRSPQAYPFQIARTMNLALIHKACTGATAGDLFTQQHVIGPNPPAQLNAAFAQGTPQLITITAGANDAHWTSFIRTCFVTNCATNSATLVANGFLISLQAKLNFLFFDIQARSNGAPPQVIMTGYYNPISARCAISQQQITPAEIAWLSAETTALNQTIQDVTANFSFVRFVPINFTGHDICSNLPWVQGVNDPAPFHPTAMGQQVIAQSVLRSLGH